MKRTLTALVALLVVAQAAIAPAVAGPLTGGPEPTVQKYSVDGQLQPSFVVELTDSGLPSLKDWANASDAREIQTVYGANDSYAVVAGPRAVISGSMVVFGESIPAPRIRTTLEERSYVDAVYLNTKLSVPDTPGYLTESGFEAPTVGTFAYNDPALPTKGMAFSDEVNGTTLKQARDTTDDTDLTTEGNGTTVAVIDTGANTADGRVFGNGSAGSTIRISGASKNFVADGQPTVENNSLDVIADGSGHGTWTAAAIAANSSIDAYDGMAPDANLLVLKALADDGSGSMGDIVQAIRYAADQNADVISMSLGSKVRNEAIEDAIDYAHDQGSVVVVAAGNSRTTRGANLASPADYGPAITVGATTTGNGSAASVESAYFSQVGPEPSAGDLGGSANVGTTPDVAAPGFKLEARVPDGSGGLSNQTLSGTSMATPLVAGGIAAAMEANSTLAGADPGTVHDAVRATAQPAQNTSTVEVGHGMFNSRNLAYGDQPSTSQEEAMTSAAKQRTTFYESLSDARARSWLNGVFGS